VFALLPLGLVQLTSQPDKKAYVCRVETESLLGSTLGGELQFLLVRALGGRAPADTFVITVDHDYTRGAKGAVLPGQAFWVEGTLMDRDTYFGEQYLFFGYPQIYLSQIKTGLFWPDQLSDLWRLYLSPVTSLASLYLVWAFPFMEEFSIGAWLLVLAQFVLVCVCLILAFFWRGRHTRLVTILGLYLVLAVGLAAAGL
jgi:hypothetical protein